MHPTRAADTAVTATPEPSQAREAPAARSAPHETRARSLELGIQFVHQDRSMDEIKSSLLNFLKRRARVRVPTENPRKRPRTPVEAFTVKRWKPSMPRRPCDMGTEVG